MPFARKAKQKYFWPNAAQVLNFTFDSFHPFSALNTQESRKEREEEELAYKEAFDYFDWNRSGTIPTGVSLLFTMKMTMTLAMLIHDHAWYYLVQEKNALQFRVWRSICGLPPRARRQMSIGKKRHCCILEDLQFTILRVHHIKQKQRTFRGTLIEVKDVVVPS